MLITGDIWIGNMPDIGPIYRMTTG